jgi:hypothetical protein
MGCNGYNIHILAEKELVESLESSDLFSDLERLFSFYNKKGGYIFPKHSVHVRLHTMKHVLCWFAFSEGIRYTCYAEVDEFTASQLSPMLQQQPVPASNGPNDQ